MRSAAVLLLLASSAFGQCALCYRTAQALGATRGRALNAGILVLGAPPLVILTGLVIWIRRRESSGE